MEQWQDIRERRLGRAEPINQISRDTGKAINTIRKYSRSSSPPQRRGAPTRTPVMAAYENDFDELLKQEPKITSIRLAQLLRDKYPSFGLGERAARKYIARRRALLHPKEVFIRQVYVAGDQVQYDFKEIKSVIDGTELDLHMFTARLSYSTAWFARCYRTEDRPALFDGILRASVEFGGVTRDAIFDNATTAVDKIVRGWMRFVNRAFATFTGSLGLNMQFAAPAKGNEKGGVEGTHGYVEDNFFRPLRSGTIGEIEGGLTESEWTSRVLGRQVIKAFNNITAYSLLHGGRPKGSQDRIALPISGEDTKAKLLVLALMDEIGFDGIDAGRLSESWRQQIGTPSMLRTIRQKR